MMTPRRFKPGSLRNRRRKKVILSARKRTRREKTSGFHITS
jgi:hypothetical protein